MKRVDLRSFVFGGLAVAALFLVMGASPSKAPDGGRYRIGVASPGSVGGSAQAFVIDTHTGETRIAYSYPKVHQLGTPFVKMKDKP